MHIGVEAIRVPEVLFQPSMIGCSEAGLAELLDFVFKMFSYDEQLVLANNVFLTGGVARLPGKITKIFIYLKTQIILIGFL